LDGCDGSRRKGNGQDSRAIGGEVIFVKADLTKDEEVEAIVPQAAQHGSIKFLANIAGLQHIDPVENFPMQRYDFMMKVMLRAPFTSPNSAFLI